MLGISGLLLRYRGVLSFALPALVCLDACHNAYVILKLYEEREKEWALEQQQVMLDMVLPMMRGIATGCQIKDKAFWPTSLAQADALPVPSEAAQGVMHPKEEDDGPLDMLGVLPRSSSGSPSQADCNLEVRERSLGNNSSSIDGSKAAASSADTPRPITRYSRALQWLANRAEKAAALGHDHTDGLVDRGLKSLRECVPVPCFVVRRRSALRVRLHWHGFTQPVVKPRAVQTCEVYL
ncbi:g10146 [Coccomyxa viridis]|uniref:G10146 protein n=1 Tax=Coccomyxa viridis TaxID=1274662 RepID=A0ABP1G4R3_9CHLO